MNVNKIQFFITTRSFFILGLSDEYIELNTENCSKKCKHLSKKFDCQQDPKTTWSWYRFSILQALHKQKQKETKQKLEEGEQINIPKKVTKLERLM